MHSVLSLRLHNDDGDEDLLRQVYGLYSLPVTPLRSKDRKKLVYNTAGILN